ncbi:CoA ester lyase [Roseibacterium beibuensis]|uniref:CoA ester lyase n=1 Tax=[Roseibacterium] beibuensis TaxID=1193142 RepID=A0ABP9KQY5_9RHOB|nr:CoA ester lyase [Roseibacterium beibuensis]MCS6622522.1 CoA ester lyase [Roseibacterium beibuensis]
MSDLTTWRSLLYVPGNNAKFLSKAQSRGADALILDLEDSVPDGEKQAARNMLEEHLPGLSLGPSALAIRINGGMRAGIRDLEALLHLGISAIVLPKCEHPGKPIAIAEVLDDLEAERGIEAGSVAIIALVETPGGLAQVNAIAMAHPRVQALLLGSEDFAAACRMTPSRDSLLGAKQQIVYAARAANIVPLGLLDSVAVLDSTSIEDLAHEARRFGFSGATAVHPDAVPALNRGFAPPENEIAWARTVMETMRAAADEGKGAARLDGKMIDKPVQMQAEYILSRAGKSESGA